jgi:hypothetical protein
MHTEIVWAAHIAVHHEFHRKHRALTWFKDHRTDGWNRRSATLYNFNIWGLTEAQWLIARIIECKRYFNRLAQLDIAQVDLVPIHLQAWRTGLLWFCHIRGFSARPQTESCNYQQ